MSHCPQCGNPPPEGARACPFCGFQLAAPKAHAASKTIVGVATPMARPAAPPPVAPIDPIDSDLAITTAKANRTIVGMPPRVQAADLARAAQPKPAQLRIGQTMIGFAGVEIAQDPAPPPPPAPRAPAPGSKGAGATLLGVARPGIAPLAAGSAEEERAEAPPSPPRTPRGAARDEAAHELGATLGALPSFDKAREQSHGLKRRRIIAPPPSRAAQAKAARDAKERGSKRALALVIAAGALALAAVLVAVLWPSPPPILARAHADSAGHEGVELTCKSCPDGTKLTANGASATITGGVALVPLPTPLAVGENRLRVEIDRPGAGRDETVSVTVNVGYRIRPDLATLQGERPSFQIVAEVAAGTSVTIDGRPMSISAGRGAQNVDVTEECTGLASEVKTLSRQVPYVVTPASGAPEQGVVNVAVGIVPLRLEAPISLGSVSPHVVTDGPSFVLAGSTMKGAEVLAAGRPIALRPDGSFAQVMNVSSVGATQIEVRARMPGMAPRLTQIRVRRVESLERAVHDLAATDPPIPFAELTADIQKAAGKAVSLAGEVSEAKKQGNTTVMLLDVSAASGCASTASCTVRLVQAGDNSAKRGDVLRVVGHVVRAFSIPGRADIPEIEVDFTLKGDAPKERR